MSGRHEHERTGPRWWAGRLVAWLVILAVGAALVVSVVVPRVTGAVPYTVVTGSMRPQLPPGTLVVVRPTAARDIGVGDVVTYQLRSGKAQVVTHRVAAIRQAADGTRIFVTRGDANTVDDAAAVRPVQIRGTLWYSVPYLGRFSSYVDQGERRIAFVLVVGSLLLFSARMFTEAALDRRRARTPA